MTDCCWRAKKPKSGFIAGVRKKLALDQREVAEIFGGRVNAFSRYETGRTKSALALVKLLKVLDRHPDLLNEVRSVWRTLLQLRAISNSTTGFGPDRLTSNSFLAI